MATRLEKVIVDLDDRFTRPMANMSASVNRFRNDLDRSSKDVDVFDRRTQSAEKTIDKFSGRMALMANVAASLGPALIPVGAVGIQAVAGLAAQFGFAAVAGGTAIAAFQGVGDALEAMNKAHLEPTAANLQAAQIAMENISPAAQDFVRQLREMQPALKGLRDTAAAGLFPGGVEGLESMESVLPKVERILGAVSGELGAIASDTGASFASDRWADFFEFLATDAPSALREMATAVGNVTHAAAEMWMAFDPLNDDFSRWLVDSTAKLDEWATGLDQTQGFQEFVDYIRSTGPQVADTLGAIGNALLQIVQAAAPLGGPILAGIEAFAKAIGAIADSDLGTPIFGMIAAMSALNLAMRTTAALSRTAFGQGFAGGKTSGLAGSFGAMIGPSERARSSVKALRSDLAVLGPAYASAGTRAERLSVANASLRTNMGGVAREAGRAGAMVAGLAVASSGAGASLGITNTASLALMGTMVSPGWGTAIGATAGALLDLSHASDTTEVAFKRMNATAQNGDFAALGADIDAAKAKLEDLNNVTGFGDLFSDIAKQGGMALQGTFTSGALQDEINKAASATRGAAAANALTGITDGFAATSAAAARATSSVQNFQAALAGMSGALSARERMRQFTEAVLDARAAVKENGETLTKNGEALKGHARAGLQSQRMLDGIAASAIAAAADLKPLEGARVLRKARQDIVASAEGMGMSRRAARELANDLLKLGGINAKPKIDEQGAAASQRRVKNLRDEIAKTKSKMVKMDEKGAAAARGRIAAMRAEIARLKSPPPVNIRINTIRTTEFRTVRSGALVGKGDSGVGADGTTVPKTGLAYADRHPYLLADGEEVISNRYGQADRYREILKAINANAYADGGTVQRLADGGQARRRRGGGRPRGNRPALRAELERLKDAVAGSTKAIEREKSVREQLTSKRSELASTVKGKFTSELFGESNVWAAGGGAGGAFGILKADIAKAKTFKSLLYGLSKRGLDGDALAELASTGDTGKAQAFASMSTKDLGTYESLYKQRASAASAAGAYAGMASFSFEQQAANKHLAASTRQLAALNTRMRAIERVLRNAPKETGREVGRGVNSGAAAGQRRRRNR